MNFLQQMLYCWDQEHFALFFASQLELLCSSLLLRKMQGKTFQSSNLKMVFNQLSLESAVSRFGE